MEQVQSQPKGKAPFTSAWTSMSAGMRTRPESPVERSRTFPSPFTATQAVGGSADRGGHLKLEPPAKFTGKGLPTVRDWVEETENWLELSPCTPDQWIAIAGTRLEKGASSWYRSEKAKVRDGRRMDWANWPQFVHEITVAFSPITEEEQARKLLKGLNQTGNVQNYVQHFRDLSLRIPSMSSADEFAAFMDGLKPAIR